jgi:hypothetical protein
MASKRLTKVTRAAFVRAVMDDVPDMNDDECSKELQAILYKHMPKEVQAVFDLDPEWLHPQSHAIHGSNQYMWIRYKWNEYSTDSLPAEATAYFERLRERRDERSALMAKLTGIAEGATTVKELRTMLPEFDKYMPDETPTPTKQLPVISNLMADVVKLGWPKGKIVNGLVVIEEGVAA